MSHISKESADIADDNIHKIKNAFPSCVSEGKIDFEKLKLLLGDVAPSGKEMFSFSWAGRTEAFKAIKTTAKGTLVPERNESIEFDDTENIFIEGDNLEVLKLLQKSYFGKVKMIYIDPPYNTGNDFVYNDSFADSIQGYMEQTGQVENGVSMTTNPETSGRFHSNWLTMMYPRLQLARNLLSEDGFIFVSIDDNEVHHLRIVMDEIFGEENFVNSISVKTSEPTGVKMAHVEKRLPKLKEHVIFYKKSTHAAAIIAPPLIPKEGWDSEYKLLLTGVTEEEIRTLKLIINDDDSTEENISQADKICSKMILESADILFENIDDGLTREEKQKQMDEIRFQNAWRIVRDVSVTGTAKNLADKKRDITDSNLFVISTPKKKKYIIRGDYNKTSSQPRIKILFADDYLTTNVGDFWFDIKTTGLDNEGNVRFTNGKKPMKLISRLLDISNNKNGIVLDFFAGSATVAHEVLRKNSEDGGNRKFICVQLPEPCKEGSECLEDGFETIADLSKERIRRAIKKISNEGDHGDLGFKAFKLAKSNYQIWEDYTGNDAEELKKQAELFSTPLVDGYDDIDVIYEVIVKEGYGLNSRIEKTDVSTNSVYRVTDGDSSFYITLDAQVKAETLDVLDLDRDALFVCIDDALDDSQKNNISRMCNLKTV